MATSFSNPFNLTAAGELGNHRESMLYNELLLRNELGRPKNRAYTQVPKDGSFVYGRPNEERFGGADDALHGWPRNLSTTTLPFKSKVKNSERDFMALNRAAVQTGLVTANENYEFRATHDVRRKTAGDEKTRTRTRRIPPSMVFGISTRPSTPIFDLLEHKYQDKWLQDRRKLEVSKRQEESKLRRNPNCVYETRASLLRTYQNPVEDAPLWQLPRFKDNAKPSLQTFRSAGARRSAYGNYQSDQIARQGDFGHGARSAACKYFCFKTCIILIYISCFEMFSKYAPRLRCRCNSLNKSVSIRCLSDKGSDPNDPEKENKVVAEKEYKTPAAGTYHSPWIILKEEVKSITGAFTTGRVTQARNVVPREADILVIGGGLVGNSVAYWLKKRNPKGVNVTIVERDYGYTRASNFIRNIREHLSVLDHDPPDVQFNHQGYMFLANKEQAENLETCVKFQRELGAKIELMSREKISQKFPWVNLEGIEMASYGYLCEREVVGFQQTNNPGSHVDLELISKLSIILI
ncbi:unnamed protein product [Mytilus edulis]|uniref:FAD dependent oxidoreductase domain-containing protein n=1 Tax=Mytilus edulis TaxID=6550 RepID=A0A8S3VKZ6_MYTED|nr:unnamed protein product [Mytilus edulis]